MDTKVKTITMRDALINRICQLMSERKDIFFLSADLGAPALDELRTKFKDRFINVGIAEQNLINITAGLALEGFTVYSYAIVPFLTMRDFEQIKNNISLTSQMRDINVNLIGLGAGLSYDLSGPSHHGIEDITIMRALPNFIIFSPSDWVLAEKFADFSIKIKKPKYVRLDSKPLPKIYTDERKIDWRAGFSELVVGKKICLVATGYMTHKALEVATECIKNGINVGVLDVFLLKGLDCEAIWDSLQKYDCILTMEEGFINKGGLDSLVSDILNTKQSNTRLIKFGVKDSFVLEIGNRNHLHMINGLDTKSIVKVVDGAWRQS